MATKKRPTRRKTTTRKKTTVRKTVARKPARHKKASYRIALWFARGAASFAEDRRATTRSRRDAAILRATHAGCITCGGTGTLYTKSKKTGQLTGSKPCPAKPTKAKVSRVEVAITSRFGVNKRSGLIGWTCPCGKREKPRYRDAKTATKALRTHERQRHGGVSVGGTWYAQMPENTPAAKPAPVKAAPVSKVVTGTGMTDAQWEKQNRPMHPDTARKKGLCPRCAGKGALYSAFGGEHITTVCGECKGTGKPAKKEAA